MLTEHLKHLLNEKYNSMLSFRSPYNKGLINEAISRIAEFNLLKENGIIVCEFSHNEEITIAPFQMIKRYHYGLTDTLLLEKGE